MKVKQFSIGLFLILFFLLSSIQSAQKSTSDLNFEVNHLFLNNGILKVGINLNWGGAIDYISLFNGPNIVDRGNPDPGREIQVSLYDTNAEYSKDNWEGDWGWNPVQAGNRRGGVTGIIEYYQEPNLIYTKCNSLHWNEKMGRSDIILEQWVSLEHQMAIRVRYKITHKGSNHHGPTHLHQALNPHEFPCIYLKPVLEIPKVVIYKGDHPWTNNPNVQISESETTNFWGRMYNPSEPWISLIDSFSGYGITLYTQTKDPFHFNQVDRRYHETDGSSPINVLQAWTYFNISPESVHETVVYLIFGHWQDARNIIYIEHKKNGPTR